MPRKFSHLIFAACFFAVFCLTESLHISAPENVTVHNKTQTSLFIYWQKVDGAILGYRIRHSLNSTSNFSKSCSYNESCFYNNTSSLFVCENRTFAHLTALQVYTYYWIEVIAFTNETFGNASIIEVFRTDEGVPTSAPINISATKDNSTRITVSWGNVPIDHRRGEIISYIVNITEHNGNDSRQRNVTTRYVTIDGLKKYTIYTVTVAAATSKGVSNATAVYSIRTAEDAPEDPPINITAKPFDLPNKTSDVIIIKWGPVKGRLNGILRAYIIRWKPVNQANYTEGQINVTSTYSIPYHTRRKREINDPSDEASFELKNLIIYKNYSVEVAAFTVKRGIFSDPVYFLSQQGVPLWPPGNVAAHNTSSTSILVTWTQPKESSIPGVLLGYEVTFTPTWGNASNTRRVMLCYRNTSYELTSLLVYTPYNITVAAFTKVGIGNESEIKKAWTDEERPKAPPDNVTAESKTFSTIDVSWDPVPEEKRDGEIIKYEVKVTAAIAAIAGSGNTPTWRDQTSFCTPNRTAVIQNLTMFVNYSVQVRAGTRIGLGNYSDPIYLMTLETAPSVVPTIVKTDTINRTAVRVTWKIEGLEPGFVLRKHILAYRKLGSGDEWSNITVNSPKVWDKIITGLKTFTTYEIKVAAATNLIGNFSKPVNVTTQEGVPQGVPQNVKAVAETETSIRVSWDPVPKEQRNGTISKYVVRLENSSMVHNVTVGADNLTVVIDNLEMYVTYSFQVQAFTSQGAGPFTAPYNQSTKQTAPDVPLNVSATAKSNSTVVVTWEITDIHPQLIVNGFNIKHCALKHNGQTMQDLDTTCFPHRCEERNENTNAVSIDTINEKHSHTLSLLRSYTKYGITVQAANITARDGTVVTTPYGDPSKPVYNKTHEGVPGAPPSKVKAEPHSTTSIKVTWQPVDECESNGEITNYLVEVYNSSLDEIKYFNASGGDPNSVVVKDLQMYTNYSARVQAYTSIGEGPFSEYQYTTTHQPAPSLVPTNVRAEATGNTTIRVQWSFTDIPANIRGFSVKYKENGAGNEEELLVNRTTTETTITGLNMFTEYKIRVAARTTQAGNYSEEVYATTKEGVPTAPPDKLDARILETFVEIRWGEVPVNERNGQILGYYVTYYREGNDSYKHTEQKQPDFHSLQLKSLAQFSRYHVIVFAFTSAGNGPAANITFKTSDDVPSKPPIKLKTVNDVSPYKIEFSWEPVPPEFMRGDLISYHVTYRRVMIAGVRKDYEPVLEMTVAKPKKSVTLENLEPFSKYEITVAAKTAKGLGPYAQFVYGETCHCTKRLTTSWRRYEPYVNFTDDGAPAQIIPVVLQSMVKECCGDCAEHGKTILDFKTNGRNQPSSHNSSRQLLEGVDVNTDFTFPVFGHKEQDSYKGGFGYTPVIESAGVAFIVYPEVSTTQVTLFRSMIRCLPVLILPIVTAYIAGVLIWFLERRNNPQDFPPSFLFGTWEGVWWAFVSMTTLGYGDRAPLSYKGRVFAILWILFGLIIIAVTMAMLTTALTTVTVNSDTKIYGTLIAAEHNSPEYNLGTRRNGKYDPDKEYHNIDEVAEALINRDVKGILVDTYAAGLRGDLFNRPELRVNEVLDYKTAYGIVLSPNSTPLGKCFERYMDSHRAEIFKMIERKAKPIETSSSDTQAQEEKGGLLDSGSPTFNKALKYACIMLGVVLFLSLIYELIRRIRTRQKVHQEVYFKTILLREMQKLVEEFIHRMRQTKTKLGEKHRRQIIRYWKLKRQSMCSNGNESEWLRIAMASPHRGDVMVTDL